MESKEPNTIAAIIGRWQYSLYTLDIISSSVSSQSIVDPVVADPKVVLPRVAVLPVVNDPFEKLLLRSRLFKLRSRSPLPRPPGPLRNRSCSSKTAKHADCRIKSLRSCASGDIYSKPRKHNILDKLNVERDAAMIAFR